MEFGILGPLQIHIGEGRLRPVGMRQQRLLATLLLAPNRMVPLARLVEAVWDDDPPRTAKRQVQNVLSGLRRALTRAGAVRPVIVGDAPGYRIDVAGGQVDAQLFTARVRRARAVVEHDPLDAVGELRHALELWRGPALAGVTGRVVEAAALRLDEERLTVVEDCLDLELGLGHHAGVVGELGELVVTWPLRERLVGQLMLALYRSGRQADALQAYRRLAVRLIDDLGLDPGAELRRLYSGIVRADPALAAPAGRWVPSVRRVRALRGPRSYRRRPPVTALRRTAAG
jgi:DNA-binding SARP family transcriptional activator